MNNDQETIQDECSYGLCDGSGIIVEGEIDDIYEKDCLCLSDKAQEDMEDDSDDDLASKK